MGGKTGLRILGWLRRKEKKRASVEEKKILRGVGDG